MSTPITDCRQDAREALTRLYLSWMQAADSKRQQAALRANEATGAASQRAQAIYDRVVGEAKATMDAVIGPAQQHFDAVTAPARTTYDADTAEAARICDAACKAAEEIYHGQRRTADAICQLACEMCQELYEVALESIPAEDTAKLDAAWQSCNEEQGKHKEICRAACSKAERAHSEAHRQACMERNQATEPMKAAYIAATSADQMAFEAIRRPAREAYDAIFRQAFATREASRDAGNQENAAAFAAINLVYANQRRARVQAWHRLLAAFEDFGPASSDTAE